MSLLEGQENQFEKKLVEIRSQQGSSQTESLGVTPLFRVQGKMVTDSSRFDTSPFKMLHFTVEGSQVPGMTT